MICLDFEGWEESGETVFGYRATRMGWSHCEGKWKIEIEWRIERELEIKHSLM